MALRTIRLLGDPVLGKVCREVKEMTPKTKILIEDMLDTMYDACGVGLAAPQVGVLRRAVVIDVGEGKHEFVNPVIVEQSGDQCGGEGCLSIPGQYGLVHRPAQLRIKAQDRYGKPFELEAEGYFAVAVCHEVDHLDGILFIDKVERMLDPEEIGEE